MRSGGWSETWWVIWNLLRGLGWPWACDSHPAPVFVVLRLQACANEPGSSAASLWEPWWLDVDVLNWLFFLLVATTALVRIRFPPHPEPLLLLLFSLPRKKSVERNRGQWNREERYGGGIWLGVLLSLWITPWLLIWVNYSNAWKG